MALRIVVAICLCGGATIAYPVAVALLAVYGIFEKRDPLFIQWIGPTQTRMCCVMAQRLLHLLGGYDHVMSKWARRRIRRLGRLDEKAICCYGDSGFALWTGLEEAFANHGVRAVNVGFGGATARHLIQNATALLHHKHHFSMMLVMVGGNDYDIYGHTRDVKTCLDRLRASASCPVWYVHGPRKPAYSDEKWNHLCRLAETCRPTLDVSDVQLEYHADDLHALNASCDDHMVRALLCSKIV